jgi:hypothetical protein
MFTKNNFVVRGKSTNNEKSFKTTDLGNILEKRGKKCGNLQFRDMQNEK